MDCSMWRTSQGGGWLGHSRTRLIGQALRKRPRNAKGHANPRVGIKALPPGHVDFQWLEDWCEGYYGHLWPKAPGGDRDCNRSKIRSERSRTFLVSGECVVRRWLHLPEATMLGPWTSHLLNAPDHWRHKQKATSSARDPAGKQLQQSHNGLL